LAEHGEAELKAQENKTDLERSKLIQSQVDVVSDDAADTAFHTPYEYARYRYHGPRRVDPMHPHPWSLIWLAVDVIRETP